MINYHSFICCRSIAQVITVYKDHLLFLIHLQSDRMYWFNRWALESDFQGS